MGITGGGCMRNRIVTAVILSVLCLSHATAQNQADLDRLGDKLSYHLGAKMPGWKHKHGEPMLGSKNVIEDFWSLSNRVVKVSIVSHKSAEEAHDVRARASLRVCWCVPSKP